VKLGYDTRELRDLERKMRRVPREARNAVRKSTRAGINQLRDLIKAEAPRTGKTRRRQGPKHDTPTGVVRRSVRSRVGTDWASVYGGNAKAPHFYSHEFGGGVWWTRSGAGSLQKQLRAQGSHRSAKDMRERFGGDIGHIITVKPRSASTIPPSTGKGKYGPQKFPEGYFFWPTVRRHSSRILRAVEEGAYKAITTALKGA
jgi:hypothetical protein